MKLVIGQFGHTPDLVESQSSQQPNLQSNRLLLLYHCTKLQAEVHRELLYRGYKVRWWVIQYDLVLTYHDPIFWNSRNKTCGCGSRCSSSSRLLVYQPISQAVPIELPKAFVNSTGEVFELVRNTRTAWWKVERSFDNQPFEYYELRTS